MPALLFELNQDRRVDSTGLKLCGAGEWLAESHGTKRGRSSEGFHLGVDAETGRFVAAALTGSDVWAGPSR